MFSPGIEPGTFCVLDRCDNRYTTKTHWHLRIIQPWHAQPGSLVAECARPNITRNPIAVLSRDRLVVRTLRCGRSNPGSNPGLGRKVYFFISHSTWNVSNLNCVTIALFFCQSNEEPRYTRHDKLCSTRNRIIVRKYSILLLWVYLIVIVNKRLTPTWLEHAAFWSGVRRATIAPRSQSGSTEIWTRIAGFKVQSANHYTMEPKVCCEQVCFHHNGKQHNVT